MSRQRYTPEFKDEAVRQVVDRGYAVADVAARLGVSNHSLYKWVRAVKPVRTEQHAAELIEAKSEILRLRAQLRRLEEERDILKKAAVDSTGQCNTLDMVTPNGEGVAYGTAGTSWTHPEAEGGVVAPLERW